MQNKSWVLKYIEKYIEKLLVIFKMNKEKNVNVPLDFQVNISSGLFPSSVEENDYMSRVPYANTI